MKSQRHSAREGGEGTTVGRKFFGGFTLVKPRVVETDQGIQGEFNVESEKEHHGFGDNWRKDYVRVDVKPGRSGP